MSESTGHRSVWAVIQGRRGAVEPAGIALAGEAHRLASALTASAAALVFGVEAGAAKTLAQAVDRVFLAPSLGPDGLITLAASLLETRGCSVVLVEPDASGLLGRLGASLGAATLARCSSWELGGDGRLIVRRPVYGGLASATLAVERMPVVISFLEDVLRPLEHPLTDGTVELLASPPAGERQRLVRRERLGVRELPLPRAEVVVGGGLGLGGPDAVPLLEELADALGGTVAGTRPVVDRGWMPPDRQVGQSGALIAPRVYIACGISGAPQHLAGIRRARTVIAINTDPAAPIMKLADIPIVGDVRDVVPALTRAVRAANRRLSESHAQGRPA